MQIITITQEEGEKRLAQLKEDCAGGMRLFEQGLIQAAVAVYKIRDEEVWRFDKEFLAYCEEESKNPTWNNWIIWFSRNSDFKRTMLLEWTSALRILEGGCDIPVDAVEEYGIDLAPIISLKRHLHYDPYTGKILGADQNVVKYLPPGKDIPSRVKRFVLETHELPTPEERRERIKDVVEGPDRDQVYAAISGPDHIGRYHLILSHGGRRYSVGRDAIPANVIERFCEDHRLPKPKGDE